MTDERGNTGRHGEEITVTYLRRQGYGIIARNWRCRQGEIDLIALDGPTLVFVEVRTRRSSVHGLAEESVTPAKQRRLARLAQAYLQSLDEDGRPWNGPWRIDVVALRVAADARLAIRHLQHAVEEQ